MELTSLIITENGNSSVVNTRARITNFTSRLSLQIHDKSTSFSSDYSHNLSYI